MRTPALNLLRQEPTAVAQALYARMARQRGGFWVVVRPNGDVVEYPPSRLPEQDQPHRVGSFNARLPLTHLEAQLIAARARLEAA